MHGVADWLEKLGLSEYAQRFADNAIDVSVLPDPRTKTLRRSASYSATAAKF